MKKVSTTAVKRARNFAEQKLTIGLDLGDRSSWYCVLDETGRVLSEQRLSTTQKAMREVFGGMARSRIALETGMHSPWVSRILVVDDHAIVRRTMCSLLSQDSTLDVICETASGEEAVIKARMRFRNCAVRRSGLPKKWSKQASYIFCCNASLLLSN